MGKNRDRKRRWQVRSHQHGTLSYRSEITDPSWQSKQYCFWIIRIWAFPGIPSDPKTRRMTESDNKGEIVQLQGKSNLLSN